MLQNGELRAVVGHDSDARSRNADAEKRLDELDTNCSFGRVDDAVSFCFLTGDREELVGVDERDFGVWIKKGTKPASTRNGTGADCLLAAR